VRLKLVGANPAAKVSGADELPGRSNYFIGNDRKQWRTNVPNYAKVKYQGVYPGVDLVYYGNQQQLEYDFIVAPGGDPRVIALDVGADGVRPAKGERRSPLQIAANGDLVIATDAGEVRFHKPVVYQPVAALYERRPSDGGDTPPLQRNPKSKIENPKFVDGRYVLLADNRIGFDIGAYDKTQPLIIDPVLSYSTYLGGSSVDFGQGIAVDATGNAYVTGYTNSINFSTTPGALQTSRVGGWDAFVTKVNAAGSALVYSTYLGGSGSETPYGITVDATGNAYVTGQTSSTNFPTTPGAFQPSCGGGYDAFVVKLNATGSALVYSTYLGGSGWDHAYGGIAVDGTGNAYVTGQTSSTNFPTTPGAFQSSFGGGLYDAFVVKLNADGSALVYSTYLGGSDGDYGNGIAVDASGNTYVTGYTNSINFPTTPGAFQTTLGTWIDAFVVKLNADGSALVYSTYLGGANTEWAKGIAVDASGNAYITGYTGSSDFPATPGAFQTGSGGAYDAFVTKLNATGSALVYSTYLGGSSSDQVWGGIAVDASGNAYVTGWTQSTNFPTTPGAFQPSFGGDTDAYVVKLNAAGSALVYSTYLGGSLYDQGYGIAVDATGNAYVTGDTTSIDFPTTPGSFQTSYGGARDAFVAKISLADVPGVSLTPATLSFANQLLDTPSVPRTATLTNNGTAILNISGIAISGTDSGDFTQISTCGATLAASANCTISVTFTPTALGTRTATLTITSDAPNTPHTATLTGTGIDTPVGSGVVSLSVTALNFSDQWMALVSQSKPVQVTNTGTGPLTFTKIETTIAEFAVAPDSTCTTSLSLAPAETCTINVSFTPLAVGAHSGSLKLSDNAADSPQEVSLTGNGTHMPIVLIPGMMGSQLYTNESGLPFQLWPVSVRLDKLSLFPGEEVGDIYAPDIIRSVLVVKHVYDELISDLVDQGGYIEYQLAGDPTRLTSGGCHMAQAGSTPTLFVFPYDWRRGNEETATKLADYIDCIGKLYPDRPDRKLKVNILAHSMGGLVARRYILDNSPSSVNKLVSIATPWLGAPQSLMAMATGDSPLSWLRIFDPVFKHITRSFRGVHQLIPPEAYFKLGGMPLGEEGRDLDQDNDPYELYSDTNYFEVIDRTDINVFATNEFKPGKTTKDFHSYSKDNVGAQDDWTNDNTGVKYYQLYGVKSKETTPATVMAADFLTCFLSSCLSVPSYRLRFTYGDETVPVLSATRQGNGKNYAGNQTQYVFTSLNSATDDSVEHLGLVRNNLVRHCVRSVFNNSTDGCLPASNSLAGQNKLALAATAASPYYYITINGGGSVVSDTAGNSTALITGSLYGTVPNVQTYTLGEQVTMIVLPSTTEYGITFQATSRALGIEVTLGTGDGVTQAIRYQDVALTSGQAAKLHLTGAGVDNLRVDTNGDGTFPTEISPTINVNGDQAKDITPPVISFSFAFQGANTQVVISATDTGAGVKGLYYSLDGTSFQPYAAPLGLSAVAAPVVYAFADDNVENRSGLATFVLPQASVTLPSTLSFGSVNVGTSGSPQTLTLSNTGSTPLTISSITIAGTNNGDFAVAATGTTCSTSAAVAAGGSCTINVTFTPTATGTRNGILTITDNAPGSPHTVSLSGVGTNPLPSLTLLSPSSATAGGAAFTLTVNGTNFISGSVVRWNGTSRTTTYVGSTQVTASITAADIASTGPVAVTVFNATPGGGTSGSLDFTVNNPLPTLTSLSPASATVGGAAFTLTVNGTDFVNGSVVRWGGADRTTSFVSSTQLTASIPASDISTGGTAQVTVFNPTPGGGSSSGVTFNIPDFSLSKNPSSATVAAGQTAEYTITVTPLGGFNQSVSLSCSGAPSAATCSVTPSSVTPDGTHTAAATVRVTTTARSIAPPSVPFGPPGLGLRLPTLLLLMLMTVTLLVIAAGHQRVRFRLVVALAALLLVSGLVACGGGGGGYHPPTGTPAGTYTLTVTAISGSVTHTATVSMTVN
jgi:pimeloyl-ACP methyl ester carboxylesterase